MGTAAGVDSAGGEALDTRRWRAADAVGAVSTASRPGPGDPEWNTEPESESAGSAVAAAAAAVGNIPTGRKSSDSALFRSEVSYLTVRHGPGPRAVCLLTQMWQPGWPGGLECLSDYEDGEFSSPSFQTETATPGLAMLRQLPVAPSQCQK